MVETLTAFPNGLDIGPSANQPVGLICGDGAPTNGTSGTGAGVVGKGCLYLDYTNGALYINTNTLASPTYTSIPAGSYLSSVTVVNETGVSAARDSVITISGQDDTDPTIATFTLSDADNGLPAHYVLTATLADEASGTAFKRGLSAATLDTNAASAVGDPVYLSTTPGGWTLTAPTGANAFVQQIGTVVVKSASVGQILWDLEPIKKIGTNELQTGLTITGLVSAGNQLRSQAVIALAGTGVQGDNPITTDIVVATGADGTKSLTLPTAVAGMVVVVQNQHATNNMPVFGATGAAINGGSANASVTVGPGQVAMFECTAALTWYVALTDLTLGIQTAMLAALAVTAAKIAANVVDATKLALYAESGLTPGPSVELELDIVDAATGNVDFVIATKMKITDVLVISNGANGANANTIQLDNGTGGNHITDAISMNGKSLGQLTRAATIDPTYWILTAGATLRVIRTRAGGVAAEKVVVRGHLEA